MRVTPNTTMDNSLYYIQRTRTGIDTLQEKIASGNNYNRPSDDPVSARLLIGLNDRMAAADQYNSNITKADTWFQISNTAMTGMYNFVEQAKQTVSALSGGLSDTNVVNNALLQLRSIKQQMVDMANTQMNGMYIFGGTNNLTKPFMEDSGAITTGSAVVSMANVADYSVGMAISGVGIPAGTSIASVDTVGNTITMSNAATATVADNKLNFYAGNSGEFSIEINQGVSQKVNIPGSYLVLGSAGSTYGTTDILKTMDQLIADVTAANEAGITSGKTALYNAGVQIAAAQSDLQSRLVRIDAAQTMNQSVINTLKSVYGGVQNVDYAQLGVEISQQKMALEASLSTTAEVSRMSLLNYL